MKREKCKPGDVVIPKVGGKPFFLKSSNFTGISAMNDGWFGGLKRWKPREDDLVWFNNTVVRVLKQVPNDTLHNLKNVVSGEEFSVHKSHISEPFIGELPRSAE